MTREQAREILKMLDRGGKIDKDGYITGCPVWTSTIDRIRKVNGLIYFDDIQGKMQISNWPEDLDEEVKVVMKFRGFDGEDMELRVTEEKIMDKEADHDDVEIWKEGKCIAMMHIEEKIMFVWPEKAGRKTVHLKD